MAILLKLISFAGLGGVGKRGGIVLGGIALALISLTAVPAIKANLPWIGTEAQLKRSQDALRDAESNLDDCLQTNEANSDELEKIRQATFDQIAESEKRRAAAEAIVIQMREVAKRATAQRDQARRDLAETLAESPVWSDTAVPVSVADRLRLAINRNRISHGGSTSDSVPADSG